jgi:hypothetical protein
MERVDISETLVRIYTYDTTMIITHEGPNLIHNVISQICKNNFFYIRSTIWSQEIWLPHNKRGAALGNTKVYFALSFLIISEFIKRL